MVAAETREFSRFSMDDVVNRISTAGVNDRLNGRSWNVRRYRYRWLVIGTRTEVGDDNISAVQSKNVVSAYFVENELS